MRTRARAGDRTTTSWGSSVGSATNRWPSASRSTSSWRVMPWQAWICTLSSRGSRPDAAMARRSARDVVAAAVASSVWRRRRRVGRRLDSSAAMPPMSAVDSIAGRAHDRSSGCSNVDHRVDGAAGDEPARQRPPRPLPSPRRRMDEVQVHVAPRRQRVEDVELGRRDGAGAEHRHPLRELGFERPARTPASRSGSISARAGEPIAARTLRHSVGLPPLVGREQHDGVVFVDRAVAVVAGLPLLQQLRPVVGVPVEQVGDAAGGGVRAGSGRGPLPSAPGSQPGTSTRPSASTRSTAHVSRSRSHGVSLSNSSPSAAALKRLGKTMSMLAAMPSWRAMRCCSQSRTPAVGTATTSVANGSGSGCASSSASEAPSGSRCGPWWMWRGKESLGECGWWRSGVDPIPPQGCDTDPPATAGRRGRTVTRAGAGGSRRPPG